MLLSVVTAALACASSVQAWNTLVVAHTPGQDDSPALNAAMANYTANSTILFQKGITYNIFTPLKFPTFTNVEVAIEGNLTTPDNITTVQNIVAASGFTGSWFYFSGGTNITLRGSKDPKWGWIDGKGQAWWDAVNQTNRPHGIAFAKVVGGVIKDMKIWKPIAWVFSTSSSSNLHIYNNKILAKSSTSSFPFNTDGFSSGGSNMLFEDNYVVNGDDCLTVGNGSTDIHFRNSYCEGGHGLSIGSLGKGGQVANVQNILIENISMVDCLYAARFKSWTGGNGIAKNVTWKNIGFKNVRFPIYVTQNYWDQGVGPRPNTTSTNNTLVQDFLFKNFFGVIDDNPKYFEGTCITDPCWYDVTNATGRDVAILDLYPGTATNVVAKDIFPTTKDFKPVTVMCNSTTVSNDVGFKCWDGPFIRTAAGW